MDQVRAILKTVWRQRFWGLSVVGPLVVTICWMLASGQLAEEFKTNTRKIDGKFNTMKTLAGKSLLPNDEVNKTDLQEAKTLRNRVREQWEQIYDRQRTEVLFWPKGELLGEEFVEHMKGLQFGDSIKSDMRGNYWQYIKNRFGPMLEIVQAKKQRGQGRQTGGGNGRGTGGGGGGGNQFRPSDGGRWAPEGGQALEEEDYLVQWLDQSKLRKKLDFEKKPSSKAIWVTQEDLWVYETLLKVIAKTNKLKGATRPDNTAIHTITTLAVGKSAVSSGQRKGQVFLSTQSSSAVESEGGAPINIEDFIRKEQQQGDGGSQGQFSGGGNAGADDATLLASRYIDAEGVPLSGDLESLGVEFRRLPVRMELRMHQRWIPQVLIECANAALPIEVQQVRINPSEASSGFGGTANRQNVRRKKNASGSRPDMMDVIIQGVVYIYNEPADQSLSIPGDEEEQLAEASGASLQR